MKYNFILFMLLLATNLNASTEDITKLDEQLITAAPNEKLPILKKLILYYSEEKPEKAKQLGLEALQLLKDTPNTSQRLSIGHSLAAAYFNLGEFEQAGKLVFENEKIAFNEGSLFQQAIASQDIAYLYMYKDSDYTTAIEYLNKSCQWYKQLNNHEELGGCLNDTGLMHSNNGRYEEALTLYFNALENEEYANTIEATYALGNIALVYMNFARWDDALVYYHRAIEHAEKFNKKSWVSEQLINTGVAYLMNKEYDKSIEYLNRAAELENEIGNVRSLYLISVRLGESYRMQKNYDKAITASMKSLELALAMKNDRYLIQSKMSIGILYSMLTDYEKALSYLQEALKTAEKINYTRLIEDAHRNISNVYKHQENFEKSYVHLSEHYQLKLKRINQKKLDNISELEEKYKAKQLNAEIKLLTKTNQLEKLEFEQQRNIGIISVIVILVIALFYVSRQIQKKKLIAERANMMADLVEKKNQLLADVSHELRTPLTVLQLKVEALQHNLVKDIDASYDSLMLKIGDINKLITDIYQLAQSDIGALDLDIKPQHCTTMLKRWASELTEIVEAKGFKWQQEIQLPESLSVSFDKNKLKQVINNLVDNSMSYTDSPGIIYLSTKLSDKHLEINIKDSAPGVDKENMTKIFDRLYRVESSRSRATGGSGLGLSICKSIVEAHQGKISASPSDLGGLAISIKLPLQPES